MRTMPCAYCAKEYPWPDSDFWPSRIYAQCWLCWLRWEFIHVRMPRQERRWREAMEAA